MRQLPKGWTWTTLGAVCDEPQYGWTTKASSAGRGLRLLRTTDITRGQPSWSSVPFCEHEPRDPERYLLRPGDLLISRAGSVGHSVRLKTVEPAVFASYLIRFRPMTEVDGRYVGWFLQSPGYWRQIEAVTSGITLANINAKKLAAIRMPMAPLPEQERIVCAIEEQFLLIDAAERSLKSALERLSSFPSRVIDQATNAWSTKPLGDLIREPLRNGHSARRAAGGDMPVFTLTAVTARDFSERNTKMTAANPGRIQGLWAEPGDIFIERSNTPDLVGTAALYDGPRGRAIFPDLLIRVRVSDALLPAFAELALRSSRIRRYFRQAAKGIAGSMPKIDQETVLRAEIPIPPVDAQQRILEEADRQLTLLGAMRDAVDRAISRSSRLRRSVLEQAFAGQLVPQDPTDEPANALLARMGTGRTRRVNGRRRQRA